MGRRKQAMTGEGELWKRVGAERASGRGELYSFTEVVSEISQTSVAAYRGGSARPRGRGESGGRTEREHAVLSKGQLLVKS